MAWGTRTPTAPPEHNNQTSAVSPPSPALSTPKAALRGAETAVAKQKILKGRMDFVEELMGYVADSRQPVVPSRKCVRARMLETPTHKYC